MSAKMIIAIIIFSLFLIFTFQNLETVSMSFLMFDISMPRALLLIITFSLGLLIGSISHGIKGLLTGLDGGMYLLDSGFAKENAEQITEGFEVVKLMVARIRNMVLDILYYAKERDLNWERVDVLSFVNEVALTFSPKIRSQQIEFVSDFDPSLGEFEVDPGVIRSALVNLLENALDACMEDKSKKSHKITFVVNHDKDHILFDIHDNGIGMDKETQQKIFTLFFSSKGNRGTGLGLFISHQIVRQHGGMITVDSTPDQGTHMRVRIPKKATKSVKQSSDRSKTVIEQIS